MSIKIQLYQCYPPDKYKKCKEIEIKGKIAEYFKAPTETDLSDYEQGKNLFDYTFDNTYQLEFPKLKLNYRFIFYSHENGDEMSDLSEVEAYAHLTLYKVIYLNWHFQRSWIKQSENIKWLSTIPISIITAFLTSLFTS